MAEWVLALALWSVIVYAMLVFVRHDKPRPPKGPDSDIPPAPSQEPRCCLDYPFCKH